MKTIAIYDDKRLHGVHKTFFAYWALLVLWQNIRGAENRSAVDIGVKFGIISILFIRFTIRLQPVKRGNLARTLLFSLYMLIAYAINGLRADDLIPYVFPVLLIFACYCLGNDYRVNKRDLIEFFDMVILLVLYMVFYSFIFKGHQFSRALSLTGAYGNELSSFFTSNHEYGMYLTFAIVGCIIGLELVDRKKKVKRGFYYVSLLLITPNLILTFSRTALASCLIVLVVYAVFNPASKMKGILLFAFLLLGISIATSPLIRDYIFRVLMKGNTDAGRAGILQYGLHLFEQGTALNKVLGFGYANATQMIRGGLRNGSMHNAYMQTLLTNGLIGLALLLFILFSSLRGAIRLLRKNRFFGVLFIGLILSGTMFMLTNTAILFQSPIDSFFLTVVCVIIPKYVRNSIESNTFVGG